MKLYVMRHGPAEDDAASGADGDRALTPSGRDRTRAVAKTLADAGEAPLHILTSPLVRCVQTAEIVATVTKLSGGTVAARRELAPGGFTHKLVDTVVASGQRRTMLCGHEPDLSALIGQLLGSPLPLGMQKAMVVGLQGEGSGWRLRFVLDPKTLAWEHDAR